MKLDKNLIKHWANLCESEEDTSVNSGRPIYKFLR